MAVSRISTDVRGLFSELIVSGDSRFAKFASAGLPIDMDLVASLHADDNFWQRSSLEPILLEARVGIITNSGALVKRQWIFQNCAFQVDRKYTDEEQSLLIQDAFDSERRRFERLRQKFVEANRTEIRIERPRIPEEVRIAVWRRDNGRCVRCGSRERLEYDHIIPISRGGSNTVRNIELLCEVCNRSKSDRIE